MTTLRTCLLLWFAACAFATPAIAQDYLITPGDVLRVEVLEDESLNRNLMVLPDGRINMPLAGSIPVAGRTLTEVESALSTALAENFVREPNVFVSVNSLAPEPEAAPPIPEPEQPLYTIFVIGEAGSPGSLQVMPGTTVLQVFAQMGGFTSFAAEQRIQLRRTDARTGQEKIYALNWKAIREGRSPNGLVKVQDGDVIVIPQRRLFE